MRKSLRKSIGNPSIIPEYVSWEGFVGVDLISDNTRLKRNHVVWATNADFIYNKMGAISKAPGAGSLFFVPPPIKGAHIADLNNRQYMLIANTTDLYVIPGGRQIFVTTTKDDWDTGTFTDLVASSDGKLQFDTNCFGTGTWVSPSYWLSSIVYELLFTYTQSVPKFSSITVEYSVSNNNTDWSEWLIIPTSGIPDEVGKYIRFKFTVIREPYWESSISKADAFICGEDTDIIGTDEDSAILFLETLFDDATNTIYPDVNVDRYEFYTRVEFEPVNEPELIYTGFTGNKVRFTDYMDKTYIAAGGRPLVFNGTTIRPVGVDPPTTKGTLAASAEAGNPDGDYYMVYTYVNEDNVESTASPVSDKLTVSEYKLDYSDIAVGPAGTKARRIYRSMSDAPGVFYLVATIDNNTDTTYTGDNYSDLELAANALLEDDNQVPPNASIVYLHLDTMFYVSSDVENQLWFSKPGRPEHVPNTSEKQFYIYFPSGVKLVRSFSNRLFVSGFNFTKFVSGTIFHSDPTVSDIVIKDLGRLGALNQECGTFLNSPKGYMGLAILTDTQEIFSIYPTLVEDIFNVTPVSVNVSSILRDNVGWDTSLVYAFQDNLYIVFNPGDPNLPDRSVAVYNTIHKEWQGFRFLDIACYISTPWRLYSISESGSVLFHFTNDDLLVWGKRWGGFYGYLPTSIEENPVEFVVDTGYKTPNKMQRARFSYLQLIVAEDSLTDNTEATVVVDGLAQTIPLGPINNWNVSSLSSPGYGIGRQDAVISPLFPLNLPPGRFVGVRIKDTSNNPLTIYGIVVVCEPVYSMWGGI